MLVELIQVKKDTRGRYSLCTVYINPQQIVYISENKTMKQDLQEGRMTLGLNQNFTNFSNIRMNHHNHASELTVVGDPGLIEEKIFKKAQKQLLRG